MWRVHQTKLGYAALTQPTDLRDELRSVLAGANTEAEKARLEGAELQETLNSPENHEAYQGAQDLVQFALAAKRWTEDDAQALRAALTHRTQEQAAEVFEQLIPSINHEELVGETNGPLFSFFLGRKVETESALLRADGWNVKNWESSNKHAHYQQ